MRRSFAATLVVAGCGTAHIGAPPEVGDAPDAGGPDAPGAIDAAPAPPDARPCTGGDARAIDPATGTCYVYLSTTLTWSGAGSACEALGGHLATPTSSGENALVATLPTDVVDLPDVWLGASDSAIEMTWQWVTAEPFVFDNWRDGEPNDGADDTVAEDCMVLEADTATATWDDRPCARLYPFLCELP